MKQHWLKVILILASLLVAGLLLTVLLRPTEPVYQGKSLSFWMNETESPDPDGERAARSAIQHIGPDAIPFLVHATMCENSPLHQGYRTIWLRLPFALQRKLPWPESRTEVLGRISVALVELGPIGVPALSRLLRDRDAQVRILASTSLSTLGEPGLSALIVAMEDGNWRVRQTAARSIGLMGPNASSAIPALEKASKDINPHVRAEATLALQGLGKDRYKALAGLIDEFWRDASLVRSSHIKVYMEGFLSMEQPEMEKGLSDTNNAAMKAKMATALFRMDREWLGKLRKGQ